MPAQGGDDRLGSSLQTDQLNQETDEMMPDERGIGKDQKNNRTRTDPLNGGRKTLRGTKTNKKNAQKNTKKAKKAVEKKTKKNVVKWHRNDKRAGHVSKVAKKSGGSNQGPFSFLLPVFKQIYCTLSTFIPPSLLDALLSPIFK